MDNGYVPVFQSTLPQGERRKFRPDCFDALLVSIHAPAGGATFAGLEGSKLISVSIHAPAGGATSVDQGTLTFSMFQSTLPQGERRRCTW